VAGAVAATAGTGMEHRFSRKHAPLAPEPTCFAATPGPASVSPAPQVSIPPIADTLGLDPAGERFAWVRSYFDAKARQRTNAGYPPDTGGLLSK
jgi:hypothetical protein